MKIKNQIRIKFKASKKTYGSPRIYQTLKGTALSCSENTVAKYMKEMELDGRLKKKFRVKTTNSDHNHPIAPRVFKVEDGAPTGPNQVLAGDITYIRLGSCFLYLAVVMDICTRQIRGWSLTDNLSTTGALMAMKTALGNCPLGVKMIFHSDRGVQYASDVFTTLLNGKGIIPSMSRKGNCYDNAYVESFFKSLKSEWLYRHHYETEEELRALVFEYIEIWYNRKRLHSSLGYVSPMEYELAQLAA